MAQFMRPISDAFNGGWQRQDGNSVNIYTALDDVVEDDTDYIQSQLNPAGEVFVCKLSTVVDPGIDTGHIFRIAGAKNLSGGRIIDVLVELRQGYVSESSLGILCGSQTFLDVGAPFSVLEEGIDPAIIANITDYSNLYIRIIATVRP